MLVNPIKNHKTEKCSYTVSLITASEYWWQDIPLTGKMRDMTLCDQTIPEEFFE
jgi:hypothetical protein